MFFVSIESINMLKTLILHWQPEYLLKNLFTHSPETYSELVYEERGDKKEVKGFDIAIFVMFAKTPS